jgi:acyl dehydratase
VTGARPVFYFEDVEVGDVADTPALTVTETHATLFRGLTSEPPAQGRVLPDLLPLCLSIGLGWRVPHPPLQVLAFMAIEWRIERAVEPGETIASRSRIVMKRAMREAGIVVEEREICDPRGAVLQHGRFTFLVAKRPTGATA